MKIEVAALGQGSAALGQGSAALGHGSAAQIKSKSMATITSPNPKMPQWLVGFHIEMLVNYEFKFRHGS